MKLIPNYSYEFNCILNQELNEDEQIKNFASLLTDKDRFLYLVPKLERKLSEIEKLLGYKLKDFLDYYIVRTEKFKSFSLPVTIEYSLYPEEMILYLLKEIIKVSITDRFIDLRTQEIYINAFIKFIIKNLDWDGLNFEKVIQIMDNDLINKYEKFEFIDLDFSKLNMSHYIDNLFNQELYK